MERSIRVTHAALVVASAVTLLGAASPAGAQQRRLPRIGVAAQAPPESSPRQDPRYPNANVWSDPRREHGQWSGNRRMPPRSQGTTIIYVPVPGSYGYDYYSQGGYYPQRPFGAVYDVNGRPLSSSYEQSAPPAVYGAYTPDLSGSPYTATDEGMMVVDFAAGARRAFPSCAWQTDQRDPQGRPRTVFYQSSDYWMVLRPGQRGRVQGEPPADAKACYAVDNVGRMVLRY
jgi:hypothetical protein